MAAWALLAMACGPERPPHPASTSAPPAPPAHAALPLIPHPRELVRCGGAPLDPGAALGPIDLRLDRSRPAGDASYVLDVGDGPTRMAGGPEGFIAARSTLVMLAAAPAVACLHIEDSPRFAFRGMHLDVARHFFGKDVVKRYLELLAAYKLNVFHWHLTDDQGFRLELKKHPELTAVGGVDGFYTQDDVREIVAFAAARGITVIPEIEMPGHARAILAAHPELSCTGDKKEVPRTWGIFDDVLCAGNDETFALVADILDEVVRLFPGPFVHIGGDEVPKTRWTTCPKCTARMKSEGLAIDELEGWFMARVAGMVRARGRRAMVWDEALDPRLPKDVVVVAWQSMERGREAALAGHDVVMAPHDQVYFNIKQSRTGAEPGHEGHLPWERVRAFDPAGLGATHVLGGEGALWTEYISTEAELHAMVAPRIAALADALWAPAGAGADFAARFVAHRTRLDVMGVRYFVEPPRVPGTKKVFLDRATVSIEPSPLFADGAVQGHAPREVTETTTVSVATVLPNGRTSPVVTTLYEKQTPRAGSADRPFPGVRYRYFEGRFTALPDFARLAPSRVGTTEAITLLDTFRSEHFAVHFETHLEAKVTGVHRFVARSDDGVRIVVDGETVAEDDGPHEAREASGEIALAAGFHRIDVFYFQAAEGKELVFRDEPLTLNRTASRRDRTPP